MGWEKHEREGAAPLIVVVSKDRDDMLSNQLGLPEVKVNDVNDKMYKMKKCTILSLF